MSDQNQELLLELRRRVTRIESRLCRLADHIGAHVGMPDKDLTLIADTANWVGIDTPVMDIGLSDITQFLTKQGKQGKTAYVYFNGRFIARFEPVQ